MFTCSIRSHAMVMTDQLTIAAACMINFVTSADLLRLSALQQKRSLCKRAGRLFLHIWLNGASLVQRSLRGTLPLPMNSF